MSEHTLLGPPQGYVEMLDAATTAKLEQSKAEGTDYQKSPLRPSSSGSCTRELYYQYMQFAKQATYATEVHEPATQRLLNFGHDVERHLLREFELLKGVVDIRYKQQVLSFRKLEAGTNPAFTQWIEGSLDMVFWSEKHKCVADVKSKKDKFNAFYKTGWDETTSKLERMASVAVISQPGSATPAFWVDNLEAFLDELNDPFFASNFLQLNLYANSDFLLERGVDHAAIIQYNKNDSRLREVRFRPSRALYEKVLAKFATVIEAVDSGNEALATRDYMLGNIKCAFCKFKDECWGGQDAKRAFFNQFPQRQWPKDTNRLGAVGEAMDALLAKLEAHTEAEKQKKVDEQRVLQLMGQARVSKVKTANGNVYEAKQLKDSLVVRRSKV